MFSLDKNETVETNNRISVTEEDIMIKEGD